MKHFLCSLIFLIPSLVYSSIDINLFTLYRTKPIAGGLQLNTGYNQLIWGDTSTKPFYGFLRPNVTAFTAGQYNAYTYELEFYPVSFIGFEYGSESVSNVGIYQDYDCEEFQCQKNFKNNYMRMNILFGYSFFFFKGTLQKQKVSAETKDKDFILPFIGSAINRGEDDVETRDLTFGLNFGYYSLIYQDIKATIETRKNTHRNRTVILGLKTTPFKTYLSVGRFASHLVSTTTYFAVAASMSFGETLKLD